MRILVVEDVTAQREAMVDLLREEGFEAEGAADARSAMQQYRAARFDVAVVDYSLPDMSAPQLVESLRAIDADRDEDLCTVLCVTGSVELVEHDGSLGFRGRDQELSDLGVKACLGKPLDFDELLGLLREL